MWDPGLELGVIRVGSKCFHSQSNPIGHTPFQLGMTLSFALVIVSKDVRA